MGLILQNNNNAGRFSLSGTSGRFSASPPSSGVVTSGLVLYLDAGDTNSYPGSGTTWTDLSGNSNNATLVSGSSFSNGGIVFDGVDDYVSVTETANMTPSVFSFDVKVKVNSNTNTTYGAAYNYWQYILFRQNINNIVNFDAFALIYNESSGKFATYTHIPSYVMLASVSSISLGTTYHVCVTYDTNLIKLYINGVLDNNVAKGVGMNYNSGHTLKLGRTVPAGGGTWDSAFNGTIYKVKFYNKVLSASEVLQNYNAG